MALAKKDSRKPEKRVQENLRNGLSRKRHHSKDHNLRSSKLRRMKSKGKHSEDLWDMDAQEKLAELIEQREAEVSALLDGSNSDLTMDLQCRSSQMLSAKDHKKETGTVHMGNIRISTQEVIKKWKAWKKVTWAIQTLSPDENPTRQER